MNLTHHAVSLGGGLIAALALAACQSAPSIDQLPTGTHVMIEMQDGRLVTGTLVSVEPDSVVVASEPDAMRIQVIRTNIREVRSEDDLASAPELSPITIPAGTRLMATLETTIASDTNLAEDPVRALLTDPLVLDGTTVAPAGSALLGTVTTATPSGRVQGRAELGVRFNQLQTRGVTYDIRTAPLAWVADATKGEDAAKIGVGAAIGAVIGGVTGGGKGAAVGSAVGAGGGTAVVLATSGGEIQVRSGTRIQVELVNEFTVMTPSRGES